MSFLKCRTERFILLGLYLACGLVLSTAAQAQSTRDIVNRLSRLENEIDTLNRAVYRGETPPPSPSGTPGQAVSASSEVRLQQIETEMRQLTGRLEQQDYMIRSLQQKFDKVSGDMALQIEEMKKGEGAAMNNRPAGGYTASSYTPSEPPVNAAPQPTFLQRRQGGYIATSDPIASAYENAFALLKNGNYDNAEKEFQTFLDNYPNHVLTSNAKYWLGETFYVRGQFESAARIFAENYQKYPDGPKAQDNLLKLGMSLAGLGNKGDACIALGQLGKDFSNDTSPVMRRAEQEMSRLGCS